MGWCWLSKQLCLDILVVVLDGVVRRMRQQYSTRIRGITEGQAEIAQLESNIARIKPKQEKLQKELAEKRERMKELQEAVTKGEAVIVDSVAVARDALDKARLLSRATEKQYCAGMKLNDKGYDGRGKALPGREVNLRKKPGGPAARKPGDMLKDLGS